MQSDSKNKPISKSRFMPLFGKGAQEQSCERKTAKEEQLGRNFWIPEDRDHAECLMSRDCLSKIVTYSRQIFPKVATAVTPSGQAYKIPLDNNIYAFGGIENNISGTVDEAYIPRGPNSRPESPSSSTSSPRRSVRHLRRKLGDYESDSSDSNWPGNDDGSDSEISVVHDKAEHFQTKAEKIHVHIPTNQTDKAPNCFNKQLLDLYGHNHLKSIEQVVKSFLNFDEDVKYQNNSALASKSNDSNGTPCTDITNRTLTVQDVNPDTINNEDNTSKTAGSKYKGDIVIEKGETGENEEIDRLHSGGYRSAETDAKMEISEQVYTSNFYTGINTKHKTEGPRREQSNCRLQDGGLGFTSDNGEHYVDLSVSSLAETNAGQIQQASEAPRFESDTQPYPDEGNMAQCGGANLTGVPQDRLCAIQPTVSTWSVETGEEQKKCLMNTESTQTESTNLDDGNELSTNVSTGHAAIPENDKTYKVCMAAESAETTGSKHSGIIRSQNRSTEISVAEYPETGVQTEPMYAPHQHQPHVNSNQNVFVQYGTEQLHTIYQQQCFPSESYHFNQQLQVPIPSAIPAYSQHYIPGFVDPEDGLLYPALHVTEDGLITVILRRGVFLEMTPEKALRLVNHEKKLVVAISENGRSACVIHPGARICQAETTVNAEFYFGRRAKMATEMIMFGNRTNTYMFDYNCVTEVPGVPAFRDLSHDESLFFLESNPGCHNNETLAKCQYILATAYFEKYQTTGSKVFINGVRIYQSDNCDVSVYLGPIKGLKMSPTKSVLRLRTQFVEIDIEAAWNIRVKRGSHLLDVSHLGFVLSNGKIKVSLDGKSNLQAYSLPEHRCLLLGQPLPKRRPGVGQQKRYSAGNQSTEPEGDHAGYQRKDGPNVT